MAGDQQGELRLWRGRKDRHFSPAPQDPSERRAPFPNAAAGNFRCGIFGAESRAHLIQGHREDVPNFDRERPSPDLTEDFPFGEAGLAVFTAGNRISTRRPRAAAILRSIARLWPV